MQDARQHLDGGRFTGSVGTDEGNGLTGGDVQRNAIHRGHHRQTTAESLPARQGKLLLQIANFHSTVHLKASGRQISAEIL